MPRNIFAFSPALRVASLTAVCLLGASTASAQTTEREFERAIEAAQGGCGFAQATDLIDRAVKAHPNNLTFWRARAVAAIAADDLAAASNAVAVSEALNPFAPDSVAARALFAAHFGDPQLAQTLKGRLSLICARGCENDLDQIERTLASGRFEAGDRSIAGNSLDRATVREVQKALNARGFNAGPADGIYGPGTRRALVAYLRANADSTTLTCRSLDALLAPQPAPTEAEAQAQAATAQPESSDLVPQRDPVDR